MLKFYTYVVHQADYYTTTSLCEFTSDKKLENTKLFLLQVNPIIRTPLSYIEIKDPSSIFYNPRAIDLTFEEYLTNNNLFEEDSITKGLLCNKENESRKVLQCNLEIAKDILNSGEIGLFNDYYDSFHQFKNTYHEWDFLSSATVNECVKNVFEVEQKRIEELYKKNGIEFHRHFEKIKELNKCDMELYVSTVSSSINSA